MITSPCRRRAFCKLRRWIHVCPNHTTWLRSKTQTSSSVWYEWTCRVCRRNAWRITCEQRNHDREGLECVCVCVCVRARAHAIWGWRFGERGTIWELRFGFASCIIKDSVCARPHSPTNNARKIIHNSCGLVGRQTNRAGVSLSHTHAHWHFLLLLSPNT
jgi:hypothetical protein